MIVACDPGARGAVARIMSDGSLAALLTLEECDLVQWAHLYNDHHWVVESAQSMPGQGVSGVFNYGKGFGRILGILEALKVRYELVKPSVWTKVAHAGVEKKGTAKERSAVAAKRLFPNHDFRASPRCKVMHDGLCDAALIAYWAWRGFKS